MMITADVQSSLSLIQIQLSSPEPRFFTNQLEANRISRRKVEDAAFRVAGQLALIAAKEGYDYVIDASAAGRGLLQIELVVDSAGFGECTSEIALEIAIDACGECGIGPTE
jgi:hypothetical protein